MFIWVVDISCCRVLIIIFTGKTEDFEDQLRSVLAQFHFSHDVKQFEAKGVPFQSYLYVPEKHPVTNDTFFKREDEAHLIKVCILIYVHI